MNATTPARQRILAYVDQFDRAHPGDFTVVGTAIEALPDLDAHTALQELRLLARDGQLELVGAPIGVVHELSQIRITNRGRKAGESATDRQTRASVLRHIAAHATERPTRIDASAQELQISATEAYRAIISLAASRLITHQRVEHSLGLVQITPRGHTAAASSRE